MSLNQQNDDILKNNDELPTVIATQNMFLVNMLFNESHGQHIARANDDPRGGK
jgi:hypothetical protein